MTHIKELITANKLDEATLLLQELLLAQPDNDTAHYLLGNIARKRADWKAAIFHYLTAVEMNPDSPAREAHAMVVRILSFSNPDLYNP